MKDKEAEYRELFLLEALENFEELNKLFIELEKDPSSKSAINAIFRIVHTLKGNAMGMGLDAIAELTHVMEDIMGAIKNGEVELVSELSNSLFRANDKLGNLIDAVKTGEKVSYVGIKTKLAIYLKNNRKEAEQETNSESERVEQPVAEQNQSEDERSITFADVIQIPVKKMDELINLVGELVIEKDRLMTTGQVNGKRSSEFETLQRITSNLQYSIMNARMVQVGFLFNKFHRIVRDAANIESKSVELVLKGTEIEIDRNVLKIISNSMIHLVRNAVGHGIESAEDRLQKGKEQSGTITLSARYEKDNVVISVSDDGGGIDHESIRKKIVEKGLVAPDVAKQLSDQDVTNYIFEAGFSNADKVTEISGRGVGMDVVKKAAESVGGQVTLESEIGKGSTINLIVPSSLALKGALLFELASQEYAIALSFAEAVISLKKHQIHKLSGGLIAQYQDKSISIVFLKDLINLPRLADIAEKDKLFETFDQLEDDVEIPVIVVTNQGRITGLAIDRLLQQKEIMEKPLPRPLDQSKLLGGTTILGNGTVCPVIDVTAISDVLFKNFTQRV
ncbi:MAG: chemotaxis protein CheA [Cyclobacteriaceae bacterium]|nr:chemotaxis protein CheA [Cyclobacteriaceae bacterium HetDA_MAG_MS6]